MAGWDREVLRAYAPASGAWVTAVVVWLLLERLQVAPAQLELARPLQWTVIALLGATLGHGGWVSWRLWRRD